MWVAESAEEVERAVLAGDVHEGPSLDAKRELPKTPKKNDEVAKDVAAMATDGGVILYGVDEDEEGHATVLTPIELAGAAERVALIVSTSIAEVPHIETRLLPCAADPSRGYLLVIVPQSPRAPHQVTVGKDLRFYGRHDRTNRILTEADVARLYERRQGWSVSRDRLLDATIQAAPLERHSVFAYLHVFARPVAADSGIGQRAVHSAGGWRELLKELHESVASLPIVHSFSPTNGSGAAYRERNGADGWRISTFSSADYEAGTGVDDPTAPLPPGWSDADHDPTRLAEMVFDHDGSCRAFNGRGSDYVSRDRSGDVVIFESLVAGTVAGLFAAASTFYSRAGYHGQVDVGVALTNTRKATSYASGRYGGLTSRAYGRDGFKRHARLSVLGLREPEARAIELLGGFFEALTGIDGFDPFVANRPTRR
jgi:hypothetical protein